MELFVTPQAAQLISAARDGDIATVKRLLTGRRVDVNVADEVCVLCLLTHDL